MIRRALLIRALLVGSLPLLVALHLNTHVGMERHQASSSTFQTQDYELPDSSYLAAAGLNFDTAVSDILWINMILYASERRVQRMPRPMVTEYADAITELDPYFYPVYGYHNAFRFNANAAPTYDDMQETNRILRRGTEYFPGDWSMARSIAVNHHSARFHDFHRSNEEKLRDLEEAYHYAQLGAEMEGAPPRMTGFALNFRHRLDEFRASLDDDIDETDTPELSAEEREFLLRRYFATDDEQQRQFLYHQLLRLGGEDELTTRLQQYDDQFRTAYVESYPYLSPELFLLVDSSLYVWHDHGEFEGL